MKYEIFPEYVVYFKKDKEIIELVSVCDLDEKEIDYELPSEFLDKATKYIRRTAGSGYCFIFFNPEHPDKIIIHDDGIFSVVRQKIIPTSKMEFLKEYFSNRLEVLSQKLSVDLLKTSWLEGELDALIEEKRKIIDEGVKEGFPSIDMYNERW